MIKVIFKNIQPSVYVTKLIEKHIYSVVRKFTSEQDHKVEVIIGRESKPSSLAKSYSIKLLATGKKFKNIKIEKKQLLFIVRLKKSLTCFSFN